jgi:hypothetical protein
MSDLSNTFYASDGITGYGAQLFLGDGASPEDFEAVPYLKKLTPGALTTGVADKTHLRSPGAAKEKLATMRDFSAFAAQFIYTPKHESQSNAGGGGGAFQTGGLLALSISRAVRNWYFTIPDGSPETEVPFAGFVSKYQIGEINEDGTVYLDVEIMPDHDYTAQLP